MTADAGEEARAPREPSFVDALAPVVVLIGLLTLTIVLFGIDATLGPLQVALFASAVFAGLVALKNGHTADRLREAMIGGVSSAMGAIFILLAVGALIGTWNMAGTIPTVVSYGIAVLKPSIFYAAVALICAVVGTVTGSSWTTAGTLGVAFIGMAPDPRHVDDDRRRRDHLRRLHGRQDVAAVGDDDPRAEPRRRRDGQRAHQGDDVDGHPVVRPRLPRSSS